MKENKRFSDWKEEVPCDSCELYYNSQCDSVKSSCNTYIPTRGVSLDKRVKRLEIIAGSMLVLFAVVIPIVILMLFQLI